MADARFLDLHAEIDRLYQAPLAEFTAARNALAARIKAAHGADAAAHVKTLVKPSTIAWTLNQLYWRDQSEFMALLLAGDQLRLAQQQRLGGHEVDVAPATRARQAAIETLLALAADILKGGGHQPSPDTRQRLQASLDALASYGTGSLAPRAGRLTEDVPAPGFAALAGLTAAGTGSGPQPAEDGAADAAAARPAPVKLSVVARRSREKAETAVAQAEAALGTAREEAERAAGALAAAETAWQTARDRLIEAQKAATAATEGEQQARADREERRRDVARAGLGVRDAEKRVDHARRALASE